jgi:hypothetical protein
MSCCGTKQNQPAEQPNLLQKEARQAVFKFVCVGEYSVGKSNLCRRILGREFNQFPDSTIGVEFFALTREYNKNVKIQVSARAFLHFQIFRLLCVCERVHMRFALCVRGVYSRCMCVRIRVR